MNATTKTIRGEKSYPTKTEYVEACVIASRKPLLAAHREGYAPEKSSVHSDAYAARCASDHYDMATVRGEELRAPESY